MTARKRVQVHPVGDSKTKQEFKQDVDVNFIVKKFQMTGSVSHLARAKPQFADVSNAVSLHAAMNMMKEATKGFSDLSSAIRAEAGNSPVRFLEMLESEEGTADLVEAGLQLELPTGEPVPEVEVPVVPAPQTPPAEPEGS